MVMVLHGLEVIMPEIQVRTDQWFEVDSQVGMI